jgi:hypothetical protein
MNFLFSDWEVQNFLELKMMKKIELPILVFHLILLLIL